MLSLGKNSKKIQRNRALIESMTSHENEAIYKLILEED